MSMAKVLTEHLRCHLLIRFCLTGWNDHRVLLPKLVKGTLTFRRVPREDSCCCKPIHQVRRRQGLQVSTRTLTKGDDERHILCSATGHEFSNTFSVTFLIGGEDRQVQGLQQVGQVRREEEEEDASTLREQAGAASHVGGVPVEEQGHLACTKAPAVAHPSPCMSHEP